MSCPTSQCPLPSYPVSVTKDPIYIVNLLHLPLVRHEREVYLPNKGTGSSNLQEQQDADETSLTT